LKGAGGICHPEPVEGRQDNRIKSEKPGSGRRVVQAKIERRIFSLTTSSVSSIETLKSLTFTEIPFAYILFIRFLSCHPV
jgi:hypothetical protein